MTIAQQRVTEHLKTHKSIIGAIPRQDVEDLVNEVSEQSQRIQQQDSELKKLHKEFTDQAIKIEEKNVKIQQLEGLLKELGIDEGKGWDFYVEYTSKNVGIPAQLRKRIKAALNL